MTDNNRKTKSKIKYIISFIFLFFLIFLIAIFNFIINPFEIYKDIIFQYHPYIYTQQAKYYNIKFRLDKNEYKRVILGGSGISMSLWQEQSQDTFLLWSYITNIEFLTDALKDFIELHPTVKELHCMLDVNLFCVKEPILKNYQKKITSKEILDLFFSYETTKYSIKQIVTNIKNKNSDGNEIITLPWKYPQEQEIKLIDTHFKYIEEILKCCKENGIKVKFYVMPSHALLLSKFVKTENYKKYEDFKREIAKRTNFTDFSYINEYTSKPFETKNYTKVKEEDVLWYDVEHPYKPVGKKIVDKMLEKRDSFGKEISSSNIEQILQEERNLIDLYMKENKLYIDEYTSSSKDKQKMQIKLLKG